MATNTNEALWRISGLYGQAYRDGVFLGEVTEVSGTIELARIEVPLAGKIRTGFKRGREQRDGTLRVQKVDAKWELELYAILAQGLEARRAARDAGIPPAGAPFSLELEYDDPDALGIERWRLDGVQLWRLTLGHSIGDDVVEREYPMTWETETPIYAFRQGFDSTGQPRAVWDDVFAQGKPPAA